MLEGAEEDARLTVLFLLWGLAEDAVADVVDSVARWQDLRRDFKPLFVTDSLATQEFTRHGFLFEHIPNKEVWMAYNAPRRQQWLAFVELRMASIIGTYEPHTTMLAGSGTLESAMADGVLNALILREERLAERSAAEEDYRRRVEELDAERRLQQRKKHRAQERAAMLEARVDELERELQLRGEPSSD